MIIKSSDVLHSILRNICCGTDTSGCIYTYSDKTIGKIAEVMLGMLELIIRSVITNAEGNATQEEFNVLSQDAGGNFVKSNEQITSLAVKANYVLYQEMK